MITITILTKNEEKNLQILLPLLRRVQDNNPNLISEILVLDSGSTDMTAQICQSFGVRIAFQEFLGYGPQKRLASLLAKNDWILNLDADEFPDSLFWNSLGSFMAGPALRGTVCASIERDLYLFGRKLRFGGASDQRRKRLFHKRFYDWNHAAVHEDVQWTSIQNTPTERQKVVLPIGGKVRHHSWKSVAHWLDATNSRSTAQAKERVEMKTAEAAGIHNRKVRFGVFTEMRICFFVLTRFFLEFGRSYILRLGFLDGIRGFIFCFFMAFSQELKHIKMYELIFQKKESKNRNHL